MSTLWCPPHKQVPPSKAAAAASVQHLHTHVLKTESTWAGVLLNILYTWEIHCTHEHCSHERAQTLQFAVPSLPCIPRGKQQSWELIMKRL